MMGQLVRQADFSGSTYEFERQDLMSGMYFFSIEKDSKLVGNGKLMLSY